MDARAVIVLALAATPALADCDAEIRGFYEVGGLFDPARLTPQEHAVTVTAPDGSETPGNVSRWENANRVVSDNGGMFLLSYDGGYYQGESWEGPWVDMGYPAQGDAVETGRQMNAVVRENLAEMTCHGEVDLGGVSARKYSYRFRVETGGGASWWESDYVLYVDAGSGARLRTEEHDLRESWAPDTVTPLRVTTVTDLPGYTIPNPPVPQ